MQQFWDFVVGAILAFGVIVLATSIAIFVFLLRYGLLIVAIGLGIWLGLSWFS